MAEKKEATPEAATQEHATKVVNNGENTKENPLEKEGKELDALAGTAAQHGALIDARLFPTLARYSEQCEKCFNIPRAMVDAVILTVASTAIGNKIHVVDGEYNNNLSLWSVIVAPSGTGKTPLLGEVLKPILSEQHRRYEKYKKDYSNWVQTSKAEKEAEPRMNNLFLSDCTHESLCDELGRQTNGLLLFRDEIAGWINDFGRYNSSGEIQNLLSIHSGMSFPVTRKVSQGGYIENPFLSVLGGIQPHILNKTFMRDGFTESGFTGRFLFCFPSVFVSKEYNPITMPHELETYWEFVVNRLYAANSSTLYLDGSALSIKKNFYAETMENQATANLNGDSFEIAMYGKIPAYTDRLAGVFHCLRWVDNGTIPTTINGDIYGIAVNAARQFVGWGNKVKEYAPTTQRTTKADAIKSIYKHYPNLNQSQLAEAIGVSQQYISKVIK